jgi:hypothetical protein
MKTLTALGIVAFVQTAQGQATVTDRPVTVVGCVQSEADYRKAEGTAHGTASAGISVGNEFILINASMPAAPTGTAGGAAPTGVAYELTGKKEAEAGQFVGKRVEISGTLKIAAMPSGATSSATAGAPPAGVDVLSKDLKLRQLDVASVRASTSGICPAQ